MTTVFLGLGSNLGDRQAALASAVAGLQAGGVKILRSSSVYETQPVGLADQPWFLNLVVKGETDLDPGALLDLVGRIESDLGRTRAVRWGPRTVDIDILLYGAETITTDRLRIPHPELASRRFALEPLVEIQPDLVLPDERTARSLLEALGSGTEVRRLGAVQ